MISTKSRGLNIENSSRKLLLDETAAVYVEGYQLYLRKGRVKAVVGEREVSVLKMIGRATYSVANGDWLDLRDQNLLWRGAFPWEIGVRLRNGRWRAYLGGRYLGTFETEQQARDARIQAD